MTATPPTVADTKRKFIESYRLPLPGIVEPQLQEFIVEQHFAVYNTNYMYTEIASLGLVSLFNQVVTPELGVDPDRLFKSFITSVDQEPSKYKKDAEDIEQWAKGLAGPEDLKGDPEGGKYPKLMADIKAQAEEGKFVTTLFFSIGLFRLLEITGAKDPKKLASLVQEVGARQSLVNRQLTVYKGVLSKLKAAKELFKEFMEREKRKQAEREAKKSGAEPAEASSKSPEKSEEETAKASA